MNPPEILIGKDNEFPEMKGAWAQSALRMPVFPEQVGNRWEQVNGIFGAERLSLPCRCSSGWSSMVLHRSPESWTGLGPRCLRRSRYGRPLVFGVPR